MHWVIRCLADIACGMGYLHSIGIVHGDLKSGNVLLKSTRSDARGFTCKLCDFGLARAVATAATTLSTHSFGTPGYAFHLSSTF